MEFYWKHMRCKVNGQNAGGCCLTTLMDAQPADQEIHYSWNNIAEYDQLYAHRHIMYNFFVYTEQTKKGWKCDPQTDKFFKKIYKQWKHDPLDIEITITYEPAKLNLNQILNWHNSDQAIQYLLERGMNCIAK